MVCFLYTGYDADNLNTSPYMYWHTWREVAHVTYITYTQHTAAWEHNTILTKVVF